MTFAPATVLSLTIGILGSPPVVDVAVGSRGEAGGGYIPVTLEPASPGFQSTLDARGGLRLLSPRQELILRAGPQFFLLLPNMADLNRPLVFYAADGSYRIHATPRLDFSLSARGGYGELSYALLSQTFVPGTGAVDASIIPIVLGEAEALTTWRTSRLHTLSLALRAGGQDTLGEEENPEDLALIPSFISFGGGLTSAHRLSEVDNLSYQTDFEAFVNEREGTFTTYSNMLSWFHLYEESSSFGVSLGAEWIHTPPPVSNYFLPIGALEHQTAGGNNVRRWTLRTAAGVRGFFDRLNFIYLPQAFSQVDLEILWNSRFRSNFSTFGSTSITESEALPDTFETFFGFDVSNRYEVSHTLDLLFGLRTALRGPHLSIFETNLQGQFLFYTGFDWGDGTDRDRGEFIR